MAPLLTFQVMNVDDGLAHWIWRSVKVGDTVRSIARDIGRPGDERAIADANGIRYVRSVLRYSTKGKSKAQRAALKKKKQYVRIRVPGTPIQRSGSFTVMAGDSAPIVTGGYAKIGAVERPDRVGLTTFDGYDPMTVTVPIRFEEFMSSNGAKVEQDIAALERMAGRTGVAPVGPPPLVRVTATSDGRAVPLIPVNQTSSGLWAAKLWRVAGIDWDSEPLRDVNGKRIRQLATVTLQEETRTTLATRSVSERTKNKKKGKKGKKGKKK